jgi:hypothetical protein
MEVAMPVPRLVPSRGSTARRLALLLAGLLLVSLVPAGAAGAQTDPRQGLRPGSEFDNDSTGEGNAYSVPKGDAGIAARNIQLLANRPKPRWSFGGVDTAAGAFNYGNINSDLAFQGRYAFSGNYRGFGIYDVSNPAAPTLRTVVNCVGGQGDVSVFGNLLFMSVESTAGRVDCGPQGAGPQPTPNPARFRGVRIFDISNIDLPVQVATVQTCRGSHTHTLVEDPNDPAHVYIYNSGTSGTVRPGTELAGCANPAQSAPDFNETSARWSINVIKVPLARPQDAAVIDSPRLFRNEETGRIDGLWNGGTHGPGTQTTSQTNHCHDLTAYPEIGLMAGACSGNGLLIDISDPANPRRLDAVIDPNFAYWHSATFNDDGTKVVFTDEWGGGTGARCRLLNTTTGRPDPDNWGANAIFDIVDGELVHRSYYKIPNVQASNETCVAHNGNLVPIPGRDVMVQAWYEGGVSVFDFTDSANPVEIAFFDRGPYHPTAFHQGGYWSVYWYNGHIYGNEIFLGFDSFALTPSEHLDAREIAAAGQARVPELNAQAQERIPYAPGFATVRGWHAAAQRQGVLSPNVDANLTKFVDRAEEHRSSKNAAQRNSAAANLRAVANQLGRSDVEVELASALRALADSFR